MTEQDLTILRGLAGQYFVAANSDHNRQTILLHKRVNDRQSARPIVLVDEIPWQEMDIDGELTLRCADPACRQIEAYFRRILFQWKHFRADMALRPYFAVPKVIRSEGIGVKKQFDAEIEVGTQALAHQFVNQLQNEQDLEKLHNDLITYDEAQTRRHFDFVANIFGDILPVRVVGESTGYALACKNWDDIVELCGLETLFTDLIDREDFMHQLVGKLTDIYLDRIRQYEQLNLFDGDQYLVHSTSALTNDLAPDPVHPKAKQLWGRGLAQIFASVSPRMHEIFDTPYMIRAMEPFGLVYYGCCEPLDRKIDIISKIPNLRKVGVTPWADLNRATEAIAGRYVVAAKPNPAHLAVPRLNEAVVRKEIGDYVNACRRTGANCELTLKDITTVSGRPENLIEWVRIAMEVVQG
ncbi:MAG: hypothetical protein ACOYJA_04975 [Christensenellales bacterium]|jgi:hypothetical protein